MTTWRCAEVNLGAQKSLLSILCYFSQLSSGKQIYGGLLLLLLSLPQMYSGPLLSSDSGYSVRCQQRTLQYLFSILQKEKNLV